MNSETINKTKLTRGKPKCCSYCREEGHNITKCRSTKIEELDKEGDEVGLFDIIVLLFCKSDLINHLVVYNTKYNLTKIWLNKLKKQEITVLSLKHNFHKPKKESIENQRKRLFYYYFDDRITIYRSHNHTEYFDLLSEIRKFTKEQFKTYQKMYIDLIEEPELKQELKNELIRISRELYQPKKFNIKVTKIKKEKVEVEDCPICYEKMRTTITTNCNHEFCDTCIKSYLECCGKEPTCPMCREKTVELKTTTKKTQQMLKKYCFEEEEEPQPQNILQEQISPSSSVLVDIIHSIVGF